MRNFIHKKHDECKKTQKAKNKKLHPAEPGIHEKHTLQNKHLPATSVHCVRCDSQPFTSGVTIFLQISVSLLASLHRNSQSCNAFHTHFHKGIIYFEI